MKNGGSLPRGRRRPDEVPGIPDAHDLTAEMASAQAMIRKLVEASGGRMESSSRGPIEVGHVKALADYLDAWARRFADEHNGQLRYAGRPGLWHALDEMYPLERPDRWDRLREAITTELQARGWEREQPPRGTTWRLPAP